MLVEPRTETKLQECRHAVSWTLLSLQPDEDAFSRGAPKRHAKETRDVAAGRRNGEKGMGEEEEEGGIKGAKEFRGAAGPRRLQ